MTREITKGSVVYMKKESGLEGYGNPQCVSWVSDEIGELSLYGHNEHYKTYDVREVIESPQEAMSIWGKNESIGFNEWCWENNWVRCFYDGKYHGYYQSTIHTNPEKEIEEITTDQLYTIFKEEQSKNNKL